MCKGTDRYRFDNKDGRGSWFCSKCGAGDGFSLLRKLNGWSFAEAAREVERVLGISKQDAPRQEFTDEQKQQNLRRVYSQSRAVVTGDVVWTYLNHRTGIVNVPNTIRLHPSLRYDAGQAYPAMLALVAMPDGKPSTMHRTWLDGKGGKDRKSVV